MLRMSTGSRGGNPFYVTEILAHYSLGIPDNVKDSILSVFYSATRKSQKSLGAYFNLVR